MLSIPGALKSIPDLPAKLAAEFEEIGKLPPEEQAEAIGRALGNLGFALVPVTAVAGGAAKALKVTRVVKGAGRVTKALKFGGSGAVVHFGKHGKSLMDALGKKSYKLADYLRDANLTGCRLYLHPQLGVDCIYTPIYGSLFIFRRRYNLRLVG